MALQYKDVVSLAETGSSALVATIRQLGGSSVANFSDKELCSSFLNVYMSKNKPSALSKAELQKSTGLDINSILDTLKMKGSKRTYTARKTKSKEAMYSIMNYQLSVLSNTTDDLGICIPAQYNAFTLLDLFQDKHFDGYIIEESGNKVEYSITLRTLTPMLIQYGNAYLVGNSYERVNGTKAFGISLVRQLDTIDGTVRGSCYNMTLKQFFSAIMLCFLDYFNLGYLLYRLVKGNYSMALNDTFTVITAKGTSLIPLYKDTSTETKNCLYVHRNYEVGTIESQLDYLRQFKDIMNKVAPQFKKNFQGITDEQFDEFCKSVILYSAFDKESQGDYFNSKDSARVVNLL